jgi:hypothetical protein
LSLFTETRVTDYRDLKPKKSKKDKDNPRDGAPGSDTTRRWWDYEGNKCADSIRSNIEFLQKAQNNRIRQMVVSARLYGNMGMMSTGSSLAFARAFQSSAVGKERITYNAIQSIVDTLVSHVGETKPRPYYLTSGGNYREQRKAKKLSQFTDGVFYETKTYRLAPKAFRDAGIWGDGFIHVYARGGKLHHERVLGSEMWVDEVEAQYGFPRNWNRVKVVDRDELAEAFPKQRDKIMRAGRALDSNQTSGQNISDMVTVAESWHLPGETPDGELVGGKHAIALVSGSVMLAEPEEWEYDFFPFARMPWCERPIGFWSQGLAEQLQGEQQELNKELFFIQRSMHLAGTIKWLLKNGSKVVKEEINNDVGALITYAGDVAPQPIVPEPIHPVFFQNVDRIIERMYRKAGVSELSASNVKPAGLDSKPALREYKDTQNDRHKATAEAYDDFFLQIAHLDRCLAKELSGYQVRVPGKMAVRTIDFKKDIGKFKDEEFILQCFPVSQLPRDPAGRMQTVQEWVQAGWISPRQARRAMDFPDLDTIESLANAQEEYLQERLDRIVDDGEYSTPEPTDDLALDKEYALQFIQLYSRLGLEPEKIDMLRRFSQQVDWLGKKAAMGAPPPPGTAATATPQAQPAPAPVSQLVPQAA